ncbi:unnamed protein product [Phaeothamnion confervicola]
MALACTAYAKRFAAHVAVQRQNHTNAVAMMYSQSGARFPVQYWYDAFDAVVPRDGSGGVCPFQHRVSRHAIMRLLFQWLRRLEAVDAHLNDTVRVTAHLAVTCLALRNRSRRLAVTSPSPVASRGCIGAPYSPAAAAVASSSSPFISVKKRMSNPGVLDSKKGMKESADQQLRRARPISQLRGWTTQRPLTASDDHALRVRQDKNRRPGGGVGQAPKTLHVFLGGGGSGSKGANAGLGGRSTIAAAAAAAAAACCAARKRGAP